MVLIIFFFLIYSSSIPLSKSWRTVPSAPVITNITVTLILDSFLSPLATSTYLLLFSLMVFHWRLRKSKSPKVSRTLLSILSVSNKAVVWMVSTRPPTSKSSRLFNNPLVTVPKAPITIGIIVTFMFHSFFQFSSKVEVLISLFTISQFYSVFRRDSKVDNFADFLFLFFVDYYKVWSSGRD